MAEGDYQSVLSHGLLVTAVAADADYPDVADVRDGTVYDNGNLEGTLEAMVRRNVSFEVTNVEME